MIKPKTGKCLDCAPNANEGYIMAGRCVVGPHFHYQKHKQKTYNERKTTKGKAKTLRTTKDGVTLGKWFNIQISMMPSECENCNTFLNPYAPWSARAYIAHIVPKRFFESVMVHPLNRLFLCIDCHAKFDNSLSREVMQMPCWPIAVSRFNAIKSSIDPLELKHLAPCWDELV
jgi:hypothetical protein